MAPRKRPEWWEWEFEFARHVILRLHERGLTELELRQMLWRADRIHPDRRRGRFQISVNHRFRHWVIVVAPEAARRIVRVITIFDVRVSND